MGLVEYSDSEPEDDAAAEEVQLPPAKKKRVSSAEAQRLPPLPSSFLDQYSSTVRTSTKDDPSLHGGRKRVTPHVEGNWPTHVYLEWHPTSKEHNILPEIVSAAQSQSQTGEKPATHPRTVMSLLENNLNVAQPLHISLSRPLTLKTHNKDAFLVRLKDATLEASTKAFDAQVKEVAWHPNESKTRWFLVLRLETSSALTRLLDICNDVAKRFDQPLLYTEVDSQQQHGGHFHVSIAWSLQAPPAPHADSKAKRSENQLHESTGIPRSLLSQLTTLSIHFDEVKVRIGQEVHNITLKSWRQSTG